MGYILFWVIVVLFTPAIVLAVFTVIQGKYQKKDMEAFMAKNNFVAECLHFNALALDSKTRRFVFATNSNRYAIYDVNTVKYLEKDDRKGVAAPIIQIIFTVKDLDRPRIIVPFRTVADRNVWYDRMLVV